MRNESGTHVPTKKAPYFGHLWPVVELWNKKRAYTPIMYWDIYVY